MSARPALPWALMGLAVLLFALAFWPGHMNADTLSMIGQARGDYPLSDHHSPLLVWVWKLGWPVGLRPGVILVLQVSAFLAGAYLIARAAFDRLGSALVAIGVALFPSVFANIALVGRDTWFLAFLLLSFGFLVLAVRTPERRRLGIAGAVGFALLCLFARQNAAAAVIVLAVITAALVIGSRGKPEGRWKAGLLALGAGIAGVLLALMIQLGATKAIGADPAHPEQYLYLYDLAGLSLRDGESDFPDDVYPSGGLRVLEAGSSLDGIIELAFGENPPIPMPRSPEQVTEMRDALVDQITDDPLQYLDWRWDAYMKQIGITSPGITVYHPGIDPNPYGYEIAIPGLNDVATGYAGLFANDFLVGAHFQLAWVYLLLALLSSIVLLMVPGAPRVVGALALSTLVYQVGLFFGTMGTQWRFEFPTAVIALLSTAVAARLAIRPPGRAETGLSGESVEPGQRPPVAAPTASSPG